MRVYLLSIRGIFVAPARVSVELSSLLSFCAFSFVLRFRVVYVVYVVYVRLTV